MSTESLRAALTAPSAAPSQQLRHRDPEQGGWGMKSLLAEEISQLGCKRHLRKVKPWHWLSRKGIIISLVTGACQVGNGVKWEITVESEIRSFYSSYFGGSQSNTTPSCWNHWEHCQENMGVLQSHCWEPQCCSGILITLFNARNIFKGSYGNGVLLQRKMSYFLSYLLPKKSRECARCLRKLGQAGWRCTKTLSSLWYNTLTLLIPSRSISKFGPHPFTTSVVINLWFRSEILNIQ